MLKELSKQQNEILVLLTKDYLTPKKISTRRKTSLTAVYKTIKKLEKKQLIKKVGYGTWEQIKPPKSVGMKAERPKTNLHALQIKFPILKGIIRDSGWEKRNKLKNWTPKYLYLDVLGGLRIRNNNNKSITVFAKTRDIKDLDEVDDLAFKIRAYINDYFRKQGVILDVFKAEVKNLNLATEDRESETMIRKGEKFELNLNKKAEKVMPMDNINGKAWIDGSPFKFSAETNDKEWKREYLGMPFRILNMFYILESMAGNLAYVAENYKSHVKMVEEGSKVFKKLNTALSQKRLKEFF